MCPVLYELGPLPGWAGALMALACAGVALVVERAEQRRRGVWPDRRRAALVGVVAGLVGLALWAALRRWGPVAVRAWGTMLMLGFLAGMAWALYDARDDQAITLDLMIDLTLVILVGAIVGARLMSVALEWHSYADGNRSPWRLWEGGLSFHGGLIGGTLAGIALIRHRGLSVRRMVDLLAPSVALGYAITRIGCFLNGCCYGHACDLPWAVTFPQLSSTSAPPVPVHPTQLYSVAGTLLFTLPVLLWTTRWLQKPFSRFLGFLVLSSIVRIVVEFFRRGATGEIYAPLPALTVAQAASIAIILVAGAAIVIREGGNWRAGSPQN